MNNEVKKIVDKYKYDRDIQKYMNEYYFDDQKIFIGIKTKNDVERASNYVKNIIKHYQDFKYFKDKLVDYDIKELEKALGRYQIAVHKVLQCYENPEFDYSAEELMELINNVDLFEEKINFIETKKSWQ